MQTTMNLLDKAIKIQRAAAWARDLNITEGAISVAKKRGRLSPTLAGNLAMKLGESPEKWICIAAMEAEPESTLLQELKATATTWLHS
jgi:hypothetical protein